MLFSRWWIPLAVFAFVIGGVFAYERWGPQSINTAVEFPVGRAIAILLACLYLLVSLVYQAATRRWIPAVVTAAVLVLAVRYLFI